ncbi:MAG: class I SAM-dependent methyltransferase [Parcubacteria group bacterium]|nr:class I SAM-dependent methyltransferase [Parcubacteria group bacterium]
MPIYSAEYAQRIRGYLFGYIDRSTFERYDREFDFFSSYAKEAGGQVLELACGAGRVMMELAKRGFTVFGIEASPHMLKLGVDAVKTLPLPVQRRIHFIQGDMRQFAFKKKFPLIIIPYNSFGFNLDKQEGEVCISCIMDNLEPNGIFIIDTPFHNHVGCDETWWKKIANKYSFSYEFKDYVPEFNPRYTIPNVILGRKI